MRISISEKTLHVHALNDALDSSSSSRMLNCTTWEMQLQEQMKADELRYETFEKENETNSNKNNNNDDDTDNKTTPLEDRLVDVEVISLSFNALEGVRWLSSIMFNNLRVLDVSHNGLKSLSGLESVSKTLEVLRCNNNMLTELPTDWPPFPRLTELWLSRNRLNNISDVIDTLSSCKIFPNGIITLVIYQNNFSNILSEIQLKHLLYARLGSLKTCDGRTVTAQQRSKSQQFWENDLGKSILNLLNPPPVTKLERISRGRGKSEMNKRDDKPWRKHMKKKVGYSKPRRPIKAKSLISSSSTTSRGQKNIITNREEMEEMEEMDERNEVQNNVYENGDKDTHQIMNENNDTSDLPPPGALLEDEIPIYDEVSITRVGEGGGPAVSSSSSSKSSIMSAMSMLPDLSSRLNRVGGKTRIKQEARRVAVASGLDSLNSLKSKERKQRREEERKKNLTKKRRHFTKKKKVTCLGGPLPNSNYIQQNQQQSSKGLSRKTTTNENSNEDDAVAVARALVAGAKILVQNVNAQAATSTITNKLSDDVVLTSPRINDDDSSAINAAKALAAAATEAAKSMNEMAAAQQKQLEIKIATKKTTNAMEPTEAKRMYIGKDGKKGSLATIIRKDGSAQAFWPNGSNLAISIDRETSISGEHGFRTFVSGASGGTMMLSLDSSGYGSINRLSGKTLITFTGNGGGNLVSKDGLIMKKWDNNGIVTLPNGEITTLNNKSNNNIVSIKLDNKGQLIAKLKINEVNDDNDNNKKKSVIELEILFKCRNIHQSFNHGHNTMR